MHALLAHLHEVGFGAAPRSLGIDDQGREVLTFMPGVVVWPDRLSLMEPARQLARVARLIQELRAPARACGMSHTPFTGSSRCPRIRTGKARTRRTDCESSFLRDQAAQGPTLGKAVGHGDAWRNDAEYIEQREDQWMQALLAR
ncbi:hypothetical protein [Streptomyces sp. NPDC048669]|uniref:hypothetical protein n=1 Tax=Streptomyces sp. NPDC048669 TaxID=3155267 RepID=UPI003418D65B